MVGGIENNIQRELQLLLMKNLGSSAVPGILVALILYFTLKTPANETGLMLWLIAVSASKLFDVYDAKRIIRRGIPLGQTDTLKIRLILLHALDGAVWGSLAWLALPAATNAGSVLVLAVLAGIAANSMSILSPVLPVFAAFVVCQLGSIIYALVTLSDHAYWAIGAAVALYVVTLIGQAYNSSRTVRNSIQLRFDNLELIRQLSATSEKAAKALASAEQANAEKSRFLAAASHDLRQPIHAQGLFLEVLQTTDLSRQQRELVNSISQATNATTEMLHTLLDYSRIEAGVIEPQPRAFRLQTLLSKIENELAPLANNKGLLYRSPETHSIIYSDPALIELILRNLISNAIRYTDHGGVLIVCRKRQSRLSLEIWDSGIGIASSQFENIFSEFQQLGNSERDRQKGLGLGLAIVRKMVNLLGLDLQLASRPGRGSVFKLSLPLTQLAVLTDDVSTAPPKMQQLNARVLVIDDDAIVRQAMAQLLAEWGCDCDLAESLEESLVLARKCKPDLIISDYRLRDHCKGTDVIQAIRSTCHAEIPAILVTGDTAPVRLREAAASGLPLMHKPVSPLLLYKELSRMLPERR